MLRQLAPLILTLCITPLTARAEPTSLAWWLLPDNAEDLPHEVEEDPAGSWKELWLRPGYDSSVNPNVVMEQGLGVKWIGASAEKGSKPARITAVLAGRRIVDITGDQVRWGSADDDKITWNDGTKENLVEFRRRRRSRRRHSAVKFGKVALPALAPKAKAIPAWGVESLEKLLAVVPTATDTGISHRHFSAVAQLYDPNASLLNFRYASDCSFEERQEIEDALAKTVEPQLSCWMQDNPEMGSRLLGALIQRPVIDCHARFPMKSEDCAMATVPHVEEFFVHRPQINVALSRCDGELARTLLHEVFHLSGIKEQPELLAKATEEANSCRSYPARLEFQNDSEGFLNDFQVETRVSLFRRVREDAEKWGWSEGERDYFLGSVCVKMGDKFCARNYFQKASGEGLQGMIELPEGGEVTWSSAAAFQLFDSISEDIPRMHQLVQYLHRDPNGTLLRRLETGQHRLHEFFVARSSLEQIQANKGVCNGETDDRVLCEDLAEIVKTPWFKNP